MVTKMDAKIYDTMVEVTWCAGCGDYAILKALKLSLAELDIAPHQVLLVSGIGCGSKLPDYMNANGYMTIHGRPLAVLREPSWPTRTCTSSWSTATATPMASEATTSCIRVAATPTSPR